MSKCITTSSSALALAVGLTLTSAGAWGFDAGSTGTDGAFSPTASVDLQLPPGGVFNFTTVNIPTGVTVTFKKNATNTPVTILASGNVTIAGTINLNGGAGAPTGVESGGNQADDGLPGRGGPGGYDGGAGGLTVGAVRRGSDGLGPGGGLGVPYSASYYGGGGAGFASAGSTYVTGAGGPAYGASTLIPLIGGSGGGGGAGGTNFKGAGGGGGGALLIASSGAVSITGTITANGGLGGSVSGTNSGGAGGGGSGGAIRIIATRLSGNGTITANAGGAGSAPNPGYAGWGSVGRIRLEAETMERTSSTVPVYAFGAPGAVYVPGLPVLAITGVAGAAAPAAPTGNADITLPADTANPVTVTFAASGIPLGTTIKLIVVPQNAAAITATSTALSGTLENASASATVSLPSGASTLSATTSYSVVASIGDALSIYAQGERVDRVELAAGIQQVPIVTLITVSGKTYILPSRLVPHNHETLGRS